ncbi:MAG: CheR family methyltransferase, partial [Gemmatimonadaceae bacterium]
MIATPDVAGIAVRWSNPGFARIVRIAAERAGLTFPDSRRDITEAAIRRAMAHANVSDPSAFADLVIADAQAFASALMELTIGETYFFRDPGQWQLVREEIVPDLMRAHPDGLGVRAWSAGCASGEEAYTLGIVLREAGCM